MIEIRNLEKSFRTSQGTIVALKNIDLTINDGEIFGIIGLSGAGKSTLVRCMNLLERPTSGQVIVDGQNLVDLPRRELLKMRRSIGMIFQSFNLLEQRNVLKNVCYPLEVDGWGREEAKARAIELLKLVGLDDRQKAYPAQLSGGQKQRVAIARALATNPRYLLCDEATSALDPNNTAQILELLKRINREFGVTIVVITHEMKVIDKICDRVAVIDKSEIAEVGDVADIFAAPKSEIAKEMILPESLALKSVTGGKKLRIVFNGEDSTLPVISNLVLECQVPVNILFADTRDFDGKAFGQMVIQLPDDDRKAERVISYLNNKRISYLREEE